MAAGRAAASGSRPTTATRGPASPAFRPDLSAASASIRIARTATPFMRRSKVHRWADVAAAVQRPRRRRALTRRLLQAPQVVAAADEVAVAVEVVVEEEAAAEAQRRTLAPARLVSIAPTTRARRGNE